MLAKWRERLRSWLLIRLRPGCSDEELLELIGRAEALQSDEHRTMVENIVSLHDMRIRELMVPRSEIEAVDSETPLAEIRRRMLEENISRLPVIDGDLDKVLGVVHGWDIFAAAARGEEPTLRELLRPVLKVSEWQQVLGVLSRMKGENAPLAIVLDEYGGTAGLVTLTDILSEIIGSMDEEEDEAREWQRLPDGALLVPGRMHIEELEELLELDLPSGEFDTVAGLVLTQLGRIPRQGEQFVVAGLTMQAIEAEPRRIVKLRIEG